jgi:prefoldin subunit 5
MATSGMEVMLNSLLKAAGFDPREIAENVAKTIQQFQQAMNALQMTLSRIEQSQAQINVRLERIETAMAITDEVAENQDTQPRRLISG